MYSESLLCAMKAGTSLRRTTFQVYSWHLTRLSSGFKNQVSCWERHIVPKQALHGREAKGRMSRICGFVNAAFKVGPSSPARDFLLDVCLWSGTCHVCIKSLPHTAIGWGLHTQCPKVDAQKCPEHSKLWKHRQGTESLHVQTHSWCVISDDWEDYFLYEFISCIFFQGKSYSLCL